MKIGIDVGGVIMDKTNDNTDTSFFSGNYLATTPSKGCFTAVRELVAKFGDGNVVIISKCGEATQKKTLEWLKYHNFYTVTGMYPEDVHFCRKREDKAPIAKKLHLSHFVDDRLEVLSYMTSVAHRFLFQPTPTEVEKHVAHLANVKTVYAWSELLEAL